MCMRDLLKEGVDEWMKWYGEGGWWLVEGVDHL